MSADLRAEIRLNFSQRETEELLEIWRANNRYEWSAMTFDVIREILQERHIEPSPQREAFYKKYNEGCCQGMENWVSKWMPFVLRSVLFTLLVVLLVLGWLLIVVIGLPS